MLIRIYLAAILVVLSFFPIVFGQSGRVRPKPTPKSTPKQEKSEPIMYSESRTYMRRRLYKPARRIKRKKKKKRHKKSVPSAVSSKGSVVADTQEDEGDLITVDSNLVMIPVSVHNRDGLYVPNLEQTDFRVFDNKIKQEISYFGTSEKPFTVVLLLDVSPSTAYRIEEIREAAKAFVDELKSQDRVMVVEFDERIKVLRKPTNDRRRIFKAIDKAKFGNGTSLYDAVEFVIEKRLSKIEGKKAVVLFTDGVDTTSHRADYLKNIDQVEESDVTIYPIYYNTFRKNANGGVFRSRNGRRGRTSSRGTSPRDYAMGRQYLLELAGSTGGRIYIPAKTKNGLRNAFSGIAEELRRQYYLGFYPSETSKKGERRRIKVRVSRPKLIVRARDNYVVGEAKQ